MGYNSDLQTNNIELQSILQTVRNLPDGGGGGGSSIDSMLDGTVEDVTSSVETLWQYSLHRKTSLKTVSLPNCGDLGIYSLNGCSALTSVNIPNVKKLQSSCLGNTTALKSIRVPKLEVVGGSVFAYSALETIDIGSNGVVTNLGASAFNNCTYLTKIILRNDTVCTYGVQYSDYDPSRATLKIYVPRNLLDSYKTATNWSRMAEKFVALEDHTDDGTTTGTVIS